LKSAARKRFPSRLGRGWNNGDHQKYSTCKLVSGHAEGRVAFTTFVTKKKKNRAGILHTNAKISWDPGGNRSAVDLESTQLQIPQGCDKQVAESIRWR